jgi:hypothetical protein
MSSKKVAMNTYLCYNSLTMLNYRKSQEVKIMSKIKHKAFRLPEEMDMQLSVISAVVRKSHQELLREAVQEIIKKYQPQVQQTLSIQTG